MSPATAPCPACGSLSLPAAALPPRYWRKLKDLFLSTSYLLEIPLSRYNNKHVERFEMKDAR